MFFRFKNLVLLQKRYVLITLSFCTLFSLFFSPVLFAATYAAAEFARLENQLKERSISVDEFLKSVIQVNVRSYDYQREGYVVNDGLIKQRNELVKLGLDSEANANQFLGVVISQQLPKQEDLIKMAVEKGGKFSEIKIDYLYQLPSLETSRLMLENSFDPNKFLMLIIQANLKSYGNEKKEFLVDDELVKQRNELVKLGLDFGANANQFLGVVIGQQPSKQEDLIKMAVEKGGKFSEIKIDYLYQLPSLETSKLMLENSFDPNKFLELIVKSSLKNYDNEKKEYLVDDELVKQRNELVKLGLDFGADKNKFLELVVSQQVPIAQDYTIISLIKQEELAKIVLKKGAKFSDIKIEYLSDLPSLELATLMLDNSFNSTSFLGLILQVHNVTNNPLFLSKQKELVLLSLQRGADPDVLIQPEDSRLQIGYVKPQILELLFKNDYKKIDPNLFCQYLSFVKSSEEEHDNELGQIGKDLYLLLNKKYKNLGAEVASMPKIPRVIHHIWLTNNKQHKEISAEDIQHVLDAKKIFLQSRKKWEHIVWTNDKNLIPKSVETLESNGIKVREIAEIEAHLRFSKKIRELIEQGEWGMASDTLRYDLVYYLGGVYADLNFIFTRDVEEEIYKYDFFNHSVGRLYMENSFFGSKANHPVLMETMNLIERNFNNPPKYIAALLRETKSRSITDMTTYMPFNYAYYRAANNGTVDVMYPLSNGQSYTHNQGSCPNIAEYTNVLKKYINCTQNINLYVNQSRSYIDMERVEELDICGAEKLVYGHDTSVWSWINKEDNSSH